MLGIEAKSPVAMHAIRLLLIVIIIFNPASAQTNTARAILGVVIIEKNESGAGASVIVRSYSCEQKAITDSEGHFQITTHNESMI